MDPLNEVWITGSSQGKMWGCIHTLSYHHHHHHGHRRDHHDHDHHYQDHHHHNRDHHEKWKMKGDSTKSLNFVRNWKSGKPPIKRGSYSNRYCQNCFSTRHPPPHPPCGTSFSPFFRKFLKTVISLLGMDNIHWIFWFLNDILMEI